VNKPCRHWEKHHTTIERQNHNATRDEGVFSPYQHNENTPLMHPME